MYHIIPLSNIVEPKRSDQHSAEGFVNMVKRPDDNFPVCLAPQDPPRQKGGFVFVSFGVPLSSHVLGEEGATFLNYNQQESSNTSHR